MPRSGAILIWVLLGLVVGLPILAAAFSPQLAWRDPIYITAGFAGIVAMALMILQPLLVAGHLPGLGDQFGRKLHRWSGLTLVLAIVIHVAALWITSPPDVIDALLLRSPTPFSIWGVVAMWAIFAAGFLAVIRRRMPLRLWRLAHTILVTVAVEGTVVHALLIDGTMEEITKIGLSLAVIFVLFKVIIDRRAWVMRRRQPIHSSPDRSA